MANGRRRVSKKINYNNKVGELHQNQHKLSLVCELKINSEMRDCFFYGSLDNF